MNKKRVLRPHSWRYNLSALPPLAVLRGGLLSFACHLARFVCSVEPRAPAVLAESRRRQRVDLGLIVTMAIPGYMKTSDAAVGATLWVLAVIFSSVRMFGSGRPAGQADSHSP